jgi:hypothetical protein
MPLVTSTELLASTEAAEAGVSTATDSAASAVLLEAEAFIYRILDFKVEDGVNQYTVRAYQNSIVRLPNRARSITSVVSVTGAVVDPILYWTAHRGWFLVRDGLSRWSNYAGRNSQMLTVSGTFGYVSPDPEFLIAKRAVRMLAVRWLAMSKSDDNLPGVSGMGGSMLTGYSTANASFSFYTPTGDKTGYADIDRLIERIPRKPSNSPDRLRSLQMVGTNSQLDSFDIEGNL